MTFDRKWIIAGIASMLVLLLGVSCVQSHRNFDTAKRSYAWLHWVSDHRSLLDRFRFALSDSRAVAVALAPKAAEIIAAVPIELRSGASVGDARGLIQTSNDLINACGMIPAEASVHCGSGVDGQRFRRLEGALTFSGLGEDWWLDRVARHFDLKKLILVSMEACDLAAYRTQTAFLVEPVDGVGNRGTTGWRSTDAGECFSMTLGKYRHLPKVYAHSRAVDQEAVAFLREDLRYASVWGENAVSWGGDHEACVSDTASADKLNPASCLAGGSFGFHAVDIRTEADEGKGAWHIADPGLCVDDCALGAPVDKQQQWAKQLAELLPARREHLERYGYDEPYDNGIAITDYNGPYRPGVRITAALATTPFGIEIPFQVGDVITELDGLPIFGAVDLRIALARFVHEKGATHTYKYQFWRYDPATGAASKSEAEATVFFNASYWLNHGYNGWEVGAFFAGLGSGGSLGLWIPATCGLESWTPNGRTYDRCSIDKSNSWLIYKQLFPTAYAWGEFPATLFSPLRLLMQMAGIRVPLVGTSGFFVVELLESGMTTINKMAPGESIERGASALTGNFLTNVAQGYATALVKQ